jgi:putative phage-type endonuclease
MSVDFSIFAHSDSGLDHSVRNTAITATDVAKILGKSKYGSAWDVWAVKTGLVVPRYVENEAMEIGTYMQLPVCAIYQKRTGNAVEWFDKTIRHPEFPWMAATPDGLIHQQRLDGACGVYEGKTAGAQAVFNWGEPGTDQVPDEYLFQATWACMVTQRAYCDIAVLMGTQPLSVKIFHIEPPEKFKALVFERMKTFWFDNVVARVPPPMFSTETANEYLMQFSDVADFREATDEEHALLEELANLDAAPIKNTARIEDLKTRLRASIGTAAGLLGPWGKASYKRNKSTVSVDWESAARALASKVEGVVYDEIIKDNTTTRQGNRPFVLKFKKSGG